MAHVTDIAITMIIFSEISGRYYYMRPILFKLCRDDGRAREVGQELTGKFDIDRTCQFNKNVFG